MWNDFDTKDYSGMIAETVSITYHNDEDMRVYYSRPLNETDVPGILLIPHMPGWDEFCREAARRFTEHHFAVIVPDIYRKFGTGKPTEVSKRMMEAGGVSDESVMNDCESCIDFLRQQPENNGKVGVIGMCSGGRHTFLAACTLSDIDAAVGCWGGGVIMKDEELSAARPVSPIKYVESLNCPLLGIFGNDDRKPDRQEVDQTEEILKAYNKNYEFHRYDDAGHGIWYYDKPMYRQQQAMDSWNIVLDFFEKHLK